MAIVCHGLCMGVHRLPVLMYAPWPQAVIPKEYHSAAQCMHMHQRLIVSERTSVHALQVISIFRSYQFSQNYPSLSPPFPCVCVCVCCHRPYCQRT